jgi:hypothetical protein
MKSRLYWQSLKIAACAITSALAVASLAGCGASGSFVPGVGPDTNVSALSGQVKGGPNPVANAFVTLYATQSVAPTPSNKYGYGVAGTVLGTATTDSLGNFTFSSPATCTAGQQAYIVSAGGNTGSNGANSAALLMAAIGPCSSLTPSTFIFINEPTTIAAAYALGQFMTISGTTVNISAPANNNAAAPSCTVTGGQTTSCQAAGLAHAFQNAANLVSTAGTITAPPTGQVYSVLPTNSSAVVPQALINTLANVVMSCVNSSGSGSTQCTTLMADTTPITALLPTATAPTNTLQALIDLAQYPDDGAVAPNPAGANTLALYALASPTGYYQPSIATLPANFDFTIAIDYIGTNGTAFTAPWFVTTDINDNIYVMDAIGGTSGVGVESIASNGAPRWVSTSNDSVSAGCGTYANRCGMATDTLGHLYVAAGSEIYQLNAGTGAAALAFAPLAGTTSDVAVDTNNNAFFTIYSGTLGSSSSIQELASGGIALSDLSVGGAPDATLYQYITIDNLGSIWAGEQACCSTDYIGNTGGGTATPAYDNAPIVIAQGSDTLNSTPMIDSAGNAWLADQNYLYEVPYATFPVVAAATGANWFGGVVRQTAIDGDNKIAVAGANGSAPYGYMGMWYPTGGTKTSYAVFSPCASVNVTGSTATPITTTCGTGAAYDAAARSVTIDDTGSLWYSFTSSSPHNILQVLGPGAPTWGQASLGMVATGTTDRPY